MANFWLVCIIFCIIGLVAGCNYLPGSFSKFLGNMLLYRVSYNGAWWFVSTYIFICIFSLPIIKLIKKNSIISLIIFFIIYSVSYLIRFDIINIDTNVAIINRIITSLAPTGTSLLPYAVGAIFYKHKIFTVLSDFTKNINKNLLHLILIIFMLTMFIAHAFVETLFVAIFTGIGTIICFNLWRKGNLATKIFSFLGSHSTNIWLTHMFFYHTLFVGLVFKVKYPVLCFLFMMLITITVSIIINWLLKQIRKYTPLKKIL